MNTWNIVRSTDVHSHSKLTNAVKLDVFTTNISEVNHINVLNTVLIFRNIDGYQMQNIDGCNITLNIHIHTTYANILFLTQINQKVIHIYVEKQKNCSQMQNTYDIH